MDTTINKYVSSYQYILEVSRDVLVWIKMVFYSKQTNPSLKINIDNKNDINEETGKKNYKCEILVYLHINIQVQLDVLNLF